MVVGYVLLRLEDALAPWGYRHGRNNPSNPPDGITEAMATLGLTWPCDHTALRAAYRRRSKQTHPDAGGDAANFVVVKEAYDAALARLSNWPGFGRAGT